MTGLVLGTRVTDYEAKTTQCRLVVKGHLLRKCTIKRFSNGKAESPRIRDGIIKLSSIWENSWQKLPLLNLVQTEAD